MTNQNTAEYYNYFCEKHCILLCWKRVVLNICKNFSLIANWINRTRHKAVEINIGVLLNSHVAFVALTLEQNIGTYSSGENKNYHRKEQENLKQTD